MSEQQTPDREKKIAEIREGYKSERDDNFTYKKEIVEQDIRFLLSELDRLKREILSHGPEGRNYTNQQVVELRLERERLIEENRKLLEERDEARNKAEEAWKEIDSLERLREDRDKLIEGLYNYMKELDRRYQKAYRNYDIDCDHHQLGMAEAYEVAERCLRDILKEIGVTVSD